MTNIETKLELELIFPAVHVRTSYDESEAVNFSFVDRVRILNRALDLFCKNFYGEPEVAKYELDKDVEAAAQYVLSLWYYDPLMPRKFPPLFFWVSVIDDRTGLFKTAQLNYQEGCPGLGLWIDFLNRFVRNHFSLYLKGYLVHQAYPIEQSLVSFYAPLNEDVVSFQLDHVLDNFFVGVLNASSYSTPVPRFDAEQEPLNKPTVPSEPHVKTKRTLIVRDKTRGVKNHK